MSPPPTASAAGQAPREDDEALQDPESARRLVRLPWRTYGLRVLGMGLAGLPVMVFLHEQDAGWPAWAWVVACCYAWPHLAYLVATRSRDPFRAELRNFMLDSAIAGSALPLLHFALLPSVVLLAVVLADKVNTGVRGLWLRALPMVALGVLASMLGFGARVELHASLAVVAATLPLLVIHTIAVSASTYRLVRKVQRQNLRLDAFARRDALTGLGSRAHWLDRAAQHLEAHARDGRPLSLVALDLDHFKAINDRHGHPAGDDVLRALAGHAQRALAAAEAEAGPAAAGQAEAGRLGGDEFALLLPLSPARAAAIAEDLRRALADERFPAAPGLVATISHGVAPPPPEGGLRAWMEAADRALYVAKQAGRGPGAEEEDA